MMPLSCAPLLFKVLFIVCLFKQHKQAWNLTCPLPSTREGKMGSIHSCCFSLVDRQERERAFHLLFCSSALSSGGLVGVVVGVGGWGVTSSLTSHRTAGFLLFSRRNDATSDTRTVCVSVSQQINGSQCVWELLQRRDTRGRRHD